MKALLLAILLAPACLLAAGSNASRAYSNEIRTDRYGTREAGRVLRVDEGVVVAIRSVVVTHSQTTAGVLTGAAAGGVIGKSAARGRSSSGYVAAGALLGAVLGHHAERALTAKTGVELVVRLKNGRLISVAQGSDQRLRGGDRVFVIYDPSGRTRVVRG